MSAPQSEPRHQRAAQALTDLGAERSDHEVLSVQCANSHHVATVCRTPAGLVFSSRTGPRAHGRRDRTDAAHRGHEHGVEYAELIDHPAADEWLPASCDCGPWSLSRADLLADVKAGTRTTHVG